WEHDDLLLRVNAACSLQGIRDVGYVMHEHAGARLNRDMGARAEGMARTLQKHPEAFRRHRRRHALYLGALGLVYLDAGRWGAAVGATTRAVFRDPTQPNLWIWWLASLAGPAALALYRAARRRVQSPRISA